MNTTVRKSDREAWVSMNALVDIEAGWMDHISTVVVTGRVAGVPTLALHLDPGQAAQLAADLISAVAESGAGEVPDALLMAFPGGSAALDAIRAVAP